MVNNRIQHTETMTLKGLDFLNETVTPTGNSNLCIDKVKMMHQYPSNKFSTTSNLLGMCS